MDSESRSDMPSTVLTPDTDSAIGMMSDSTPDSEETLTNSNSESLKDESLLEEEDDMMENGSVVAASMQFALTPSSTSKECDEDKEVPKISSTGVPVCVKHYKEPLSTVTSEGTDDLVCDIEQEGTDKPPILREEKERSPLLIEEKEKFPLYKEEKEKSSLPNKERERSPLPKEENEKSPLLREEKERTPLQREEKEKSPLSREEKERTPLQREEKEKSPLPREEKERTPLLREEKEKSPLLREEKERTPLPKEEKEKSPLPREEKERTPLPREEKEKSLLSREKTERSLLEEGGKSSLPRDNREESPISKEEPETYNNGLPETVTRLTNEQGSEVYLVGTAHFSKESQEDVEKTIRMVRPDVVMLELCKSRTDILQLDAETLLNESKSLDFNKICSILKQQGKIQGILYLLLLYVSANITKQLGMAPGGEFRAAFSEARRSAPGCIIQLGDRPIKITLSRALASLSIWQKAKFMWHVMASKEPISKEDVEKFKQKDLLEELLADMTGQFPAMSEVLVKERDIYLAKSLQTAARVASNRKSPTGISPRIVVGVVGIGHVRGIVENWGKVADEDIPPIISIPSPSMSDKICKMTLKIAFYGAVGYGIYKCLPNSFKSSVYSAVESNLQSLSKLVVSN